MSKNGWNKKPIGWENIDLYHNKKLDYNKYNLKHIDKKIDIIFVLAGGINENTKEVHDFVKLRLNYSKKYNKLNKNSKIILLGGGTYHKEPILNEEKYVIHESTSCADYLVKIGVNEKKIIKEWSSFDTIANGFFAFTNFINIMNPKNILIITSDFHMERSKLIFEFMKKIFNFSGNIFYQETEDLMNENILKERKKREENSCKNFKNNIIDKNYNLENFFNWFYFEHNCYNVKGQYKIKKINDTIKKCY